MRVRVEVEAAGDVRGGTSDELTKPTKASSVSSVSERVNQ